MLEKQRHELILQELSERRFASVQELAERLVASEVTIRRDVNKLAERGLLKRIHGGAESLSPTIRGPALSRINSSDFNTDKEKNTHQKRMIAKKAVEMCVDGEAVIINGGSSTYMMAEFLKVRKLRILTNSMVLAQELWDSGDSQISLPGGEIYREQGIILSSHEIDGLQNYSCTKMFMGTPGIGEFGVTESDPLLIRTEQKLRKQADKLIILADSSKINRRGNFVFSALQDVDVLITDANADPAALKMFETFGVSIVVADDV